MDVQYGSTDGEKASMAQEQQNPPPYQTPGYMGYPQPGPAPIGAYPQQPYPAQLAYPAPGQTVIAVQPQTGVPLYPPEKDYLGYSIFTMLCCCLPLGIAALVHSIFTREANHRGDHVAAERNSRTALKLNHWSLGLGIIGIIIIIAWVTVMASADEP